MVLEDGRTFTGTSFGADGETFGEMVFNILRGVDQVAFVRFASVYREFKDVNDFVEELEPMLRTPIRDLD